MRIPRQQLKILFADILRGYSLLTVSNRVLYLKHLTNFDVADIDCEQEKFLLHAKSNGLPTREQKELELVTSGLWSDKKDREIQEHKTFIENAKISRSKHFQKDLIREIDAQIENAARVVRRLEEEKDFLAGDTAEKYAAKRVNEYYIFKSIFGDADCRIPYFTKEEFNDLEDAALNEIVVAYNDKTAHFEAENLQRIALLSSFLNFFYLCNDDPRVFYGKPVMQLSFYQAELFGFARYFKRILSELKTPPTDDLLDAPEKLIALHTGTQNVQKHVSESGNVAIVGASQSDLKKMGVNVDSGIDLAREAKKRGKKSLDMADLIEIQGAD